MSWETFPDKFQHSQKPTELNECQQPVYQTPSIGIPTLETAWDIRYSKSATVNQLPQSPYQQPTAYIDFKFNYAPFITSLAKPPQNSNVKKRERSRKYWSRRKSFKHLIAETFLSDPKDNRPYADVSINGRSYRGLLDSGASISALGVGSEFFINNKQIPFHHFSSSIQTASGESQRIFGYIWVKVSFNGQEKPMNIFVIPSLKQELYLGIDFWKLFNISPTIISEISSSIDIIGPSNPMRHDLNTQQQLQLNAVISQLPSSVKLGLGKTNFLEHKIDVGSALPVKQRYYAVSPAIQSVMYAELDRMLSLGVIEESNSAWSSPMTLVRKANGKARLCLDARKLNEVTTKDAYPLPFIDGLLGRLDQTKYISSLDLKDAFWQIPLAKESRDKTAFTAPGRPLYQFTVMPFGLCNAAQTLCRLMHRVIPHALHCQIFVYLDDLLIATATFEEHVLLLEQVASLLSSANLTINVEKSQFVLKQIKYLGYLVGDGCLKVDPDKMRAIEDFPVPKTTKGLRRFLGMTGWFRRFIRSYSEVTSPLTDLLKKNQKYAWNNAANSAFEHLKQALTTAPVLVNPNFDKRFYIRCDASTTGIGAVLYQKSEEGSDHPISFVSQKLNNAQRNYSITELECYAAVLAVKKFRAYVEGHPFTIITDHASLQWLMRQRDLSGRLARWSLKLQAFDFQIQYCKGSENVVPDALSRATVDEIHSIPPPSDPSKEVLHVNLNSTYFQDPTYVKQVKEVQSCPANTTNFSVVDDKLYISPSSGWDRLDTDIPSWKLVIPEPMVPVLIKQAHDSPSSAHLGVAKTLERLQRLYYWPRMTTDVKTYVSRCVKCKEVKAPNYTLRPGMGSQREAVRPMQHLYIDFLGPYPRTKAGNSYIFIVVDAYTRFVFLQAMKQATAPMVVRFLEHNIFTLFSVPETVLSDNGTQFNGKILGDLLNKYGVAHIQTPKYSPQANMSERVNRTLLAAIRAYVKEDHREWDLHLSEIASALRNAVHGSTKFSPHYLMFGNHMISHGDDYKVLRQLNCLTEPEVAINSRINRLSHAQVLVLEHLKKSHTQSQLRYNLRSNQRVLQVGQNVFVRNFAQSDAACKYSAKLAPKFIKAEVCRKIGNVAYELKDANHKMLGIYHLKDIKV